MYQFFEFLHFDVFSANVERIEQNKFQGSDNRTNSSAPRQPEKDLPRQLIGIQTSAPMFECNV